MKTKIKIDPKVAKIGFTLLGMAFTGIGSMITSNVQHKDQKEAMTEIAKTAIEEALKNQVKGS
jgi:hypothetical protein